MTVNFITIILSGIALAGINSVMSCKLAVGRITGDQATVGQTIVDQAAVDQISIESSKVDCCNA